MINCDVLIVGGGPAGTSLAWSLRDSGLDVHLVDKRAFPRDKVCAGWITPAVVSELQIDLADYADGRILQPIYGFRVSRIGGREVETRKSDHVVSYAIRRCEFDNYLLKRCGAHVHEGVAFKNVEANSDGLLVNGEFQTRMLVGAGGHFCPVARTLGATLGSGETVVAAQEIEFRMTPEQAATCRIDPQVPELFFCDDLAGYGWVVRKGDYLNVGLGREDSHRLAEHVQAFCDYLIGHGKVPTDIVRKFPGHAYLLYPHAQRRIVDQGILLIGDAAGLAYPQSGEGIRPAVESALLAAQVIKSSRSDYSAEVLAEYQRRLEQRLGKRQQISFSDRLPDWLTRFLGGRLLATHWFVQNVVMQKWFLHAQQPPLATE